jgi:integrase
MFTGARIGEIASLRAGDIKQEAGHWYIDLLDDPDSGRRFKTDASRRHVPIHPELARMGFVDWARKQKGQLFPTFKPYQGKHGHYLSKDFGRWLRGTAGITDPRKVFHSFRHKMKDALRAAEVPDTLQEAILGHEGRTVGDGYGDGYEIPTKAAAMARVRIPVTLPA